MDISFGFIAKSVLLGTGLAMDAFSVSLANGLNEPKMKKPRMSLIAGIFSLFQFIMPLIGWVCVHTIAQKFASFERFIPWIALFLLGFIGYEMISEGIKNQGAENEKPAVGLVGLIIQGIATSIDALSVGFTIAGYNWPEATLCCAIIGVVTFIICLLGLKLGKKFGTRFSGRASLLGGSILIFIGLEIFITSIF